MSKEQVYEFLAVYGWAIAVVCIAIGALAYFGVLPPYYPNQECCDLFCQSIDGQICIDYDYRANTVTCAGADYYKEDDSPLDIRTSIQYHMENPMQTCNNIQDNTGDYVMEE